MTIPDIEQLHDEACAANQTFYTDPDTGLFVFTAHHLSSRPCCHSGCRHCPYSKIASPAPKLLSGSLNHLPLHVQVLFWSGGKDSFLTLRSLPKHNLVLLTTYDARAQRVAMQDVSIRDVIRQAHVLNLPLLGVPVGADYVETIQRALNKLRDAGLEPTCLNFGDLHLSHIRQWREKHLANLNVKLAFPLWHLSYESLITQLECAAVVVRISAVDPGDQRLNSIHVGDIFDKNFLQKLPHGVDKFGENGEFHTLVEVWNKTSDKTLASLTPPKARLNETTPSYFDPHPGRSTGS